MTFAHSDPEAFWNNLLDNLQQFVEAGQDAPRLAQWDKDPDYIWKPPKPDRDGGASAGCVTSVRSLTVSRRSFIVRVIPEVAWLKKSSRSGIIG